MHKILIAAAAAFALCSAPAGAAVVTAGTLHATDADSGATSLAITCQDAQAYVSGTPTGAPCDTIELIVIDSYSTPNTVDLTGTGAEAGFARLTETRLTAG